MYATVREAKQAALRAQTERSNRVMSPWARRALMGTLPVKDLTRSAAR